MVSKKYNIAVVGATGAVGQMMIKILMERKFPVNNLYPLASKKSEGKTITINNYNYQVSSLDEFDFKKVDIALFSAGGDISEKYAKIATKNNVIVIDNTSFFRYKDNIPLIVPEVNSEKIALYKDTGIIANPNCSTIQMLVAIKPIHDVCKIKRINVCTYQAVSGSGNEAIDELNNQVHAYVKNESISKNIYPKQIAFNVIPQIDKFMENGYTKEEMKMVWETQKILDKDISVNATAVRVPVLVGHSESITIETAKSLDIEIVKEDFKKQNGIQLMDDPSNDEYPTAFENGHGTDDVFVGRVRRSLDNDKVLNIWVVADNVRKGAALNSIQIAEELIKGDA